MKQIMIVKPNELSKEDKGKLSKAGYMVIEHPNPETVRIITPIEELNGGHILLSAMEALETPYGKHETFCKSLAKRLLDDSKP